MLAMVLRRIFWLLKKNEAVGQVFNIGSGTGISIKELAETLIDMSGKGLGIIYDNPDEGCASRYQPERIRLKGELKNFILDTKKASKLLGWRPLTKFREGLLKEIDWVMMNKERWNVKPRV